MDNKTVPKKTIINKNNGIFIICELIKQCFELSENQVKRKCYGNTLNKNCKEDCIYYFDRTINCAGRVENTRCDNCFIKNLNLNHLCKHAKRFYFNRKG